MLVWITGANPYWARRLHALAGRDDLRLVCWFTRHVDEDREWVVTKDQLDFVNAVLPEKAIRRLIFVLSGLLKVRPTHILTIHFQPLYWLALPARLFGCKTAFYVEKTFDSWFRRTKLKETVKFFIFRCVSVIFVPGSDARHYVSKYSPNAAFRKLTPEVDLRYLKEARTLRSPAPELRFLYLGRLVEEKGIRTMLEAFAIASSAGVRYSLKIVGSGPLRKTVDEWCAISGGRASHLPFIQANSLLPVFATSDVLVFPTTGDPYGLVVNEALAAGLAVISSDAAGEIVERLGCGDVLAKRGAIFPTGDSVAMAARIIDLVNEPDMVTRMKSEAVSYADLTFETGTWVESVIRWLNDDPGYPFLSDAGAQSNVIR